MKKRVCPWWLGYLLACPLRRLSENPVKLLTPYVHPGMTVLEPGPGMGFFTLDLARMAGDSGRVIAVDIQPRMLERLKRRAAKSGVADRIEARLASSESMNVANLAGTVDFTLAFAVVHEFPAPAPFFKQVAEASRHGALVLFAEPSGHVNAQEFEAELQAAKEAGFVVEERPSVRHSHAAVLRKC